MRSRIKRSRSRRSRRSRHRRRKNGIENIILNLLLVVCMAVFLFSGWKLVTSIIEYRKGEETYEAIFQEAVVLPEQDKTAASDEEVILPVIDWDKLKGMNNDLVGWMYIPDTNIQYPVVHGSDNSFYLTHTFDGKENACGAIFMDKKNKGDYSSDNTVLHGHNMKNGTMFGSLRKYEEKSYWEKHPYIFIIKENTVMKYEIFSVGITEAASDVYTLEFGSEESFKNYIVDRTKLGCIYETGVTVTTEDKILTLSTCTSDSEEGRRVVQAKLIEEKGIQE